MNTPGQPVHCLYCGHEFPQDPVFEVECPDCGAKPGRKCRVKRPSDHVHGPEWGGLPSWGHDSRDLLASERGFYDHICIPKEQRVLRDSKPREGQLQIEMDLT